MTLAYAKALRTANQADTSQVTGSRWGYASVRPGWRAAREIAL